MAHPKPNRLIQTRSFVVHNNIRMNALRILPLALLVPHGVAVAAQQPAAPTPIKAYYQLADTLLKKMDIPAMHKQMLDSHTKDFQSSSLPDKSGKVTHRNLDESVRSLKPQFELIQELTKVGTHIDSAKAEGETYVLTVSTSIAATMKKMRDGLVHKMTIAGISEDTWVKSGSKWLLKATKVMSRQVTLDGQPIRLR